MKDYIAERKELSFKEAMAILNKTGKKEVSKNAWNCQHCGNDEKTISKYGDFCKECLRRC